MSNSLFSTANLFSTDVSNSTLAGARFVGVDLAEANFTDANLQGATFRRVDLRDTNFVGARPRDTKWEDVDHLAEARFSVYVLLYADQERASLMTDHQWLTALSGDLDLLREIHRDKPEYFQKVLKRLELETFVQFERRLKRLVAEAGKQGNFGNGPG